MDMKNFHHFKSTAVLHGSCFGMISFYVNGLSSQLNWEKYQFSDKYFLHVISITWYNVPW